MDGSSGRTAYKGADADIRLRPEKLPCWQVAASVVAVPVVALLFACLVACLAMVVLVASQGRDGATEFIQSLEFDFPLKTRLSAAVVGILYAGVAMGTLAVAAIAGRGGWRRMVALLPPRGRRRDLAAIAVCTLAYAGVATFAMTHFQERHLTVSGRTDVLLIATILTNLVVLAPLAEELFFRGFLYTALRDRLPFWPAFLATAALFAAIHWDANHRRILLVLPLALALGLLREVTRSIMPTIALHATYNLLIVAITLLET